MFTSAACWSKHPKGYVKVLWDINQKHLKQGRKETAGKSSPMLIKQISGSADATTILSAKGKRKCGRHSSGKGTGLLCMGNDDRKHYYGDCSTRKIKKCITALGLSRVK